MLNLYFLSLFLSTLDSSLSFDAFFLKIQACDFDKIFYLDTLWIFISMN